MSCINTAHLAMRRIGSSWFVKHIPSRRWYRLDGALAILWDALQASDTEHEAATVCVGHFGGSENAASDMPELLDRLAEEDLIRHGGIDGSSKVRSSPFTATTDDSIQDELYQSALQEGCPLLVEYEMTYRCNLRCAYCYQPNYLKHRRLAELSRDEISTMIKDFAESGVVFLVVTGGECTLHKHFRHVVSEARSHSMDVTVLTNGTALTPDLVDFLAAQVVSEIKVSVYGHSPEEYRAFTGFAAGHTRAWEGLTRAKDAGVRIVGKVVVTSCHERTFARTIELLQNLGIEVEVSAHVMPAMDGQLFPLQYRVSTRTLEQLFRQNALRSGGGRSCTAGSTKFRVSPEGLVTSCELERTTLGDVRSLSLKDIATRAHLGLVPLLRRRAGELSTDETTRGLPCPALPRLEAGSWSASPTEAIRWTQAATNSHIGGG